MFITCQQCRTIFRLDESLLEPTGSKVRCSQCGNIFVEYPPPSEPQPADVESTAAVETVSQAPSEAALDQELEGIDLDELDSILEQSEMDALSDALAMDEDVTRPTEETTEAAAADLNEDDLEMDFDLGQEPVSDTELELEAEPVPAQEAAADEGLDDLDLDMDFTIDTGEGPDQPDTAPAAPAAETAGDDLEVDLGDLDNIDFSLETEGADAVMDVDAAPVVEEDSDLMDFDLEFDDTPAEAESIEPDQATEVEAQEADLSLDDDLGSLDEIEASAPTSADASDDFDLSELDAMLGGGEAPGQISKGISREEIDEDIELSLAGESGQPGGTTSEPAMEIEEESEGLDLSDLDAMLDDVGSDADQEEAADISPDVSMDDDLDLEDLEFELDAEFEDKPIAQQSATAAKDADAEATAPEDEDEEIDLSDIEQMLEDDGEALDTQQLEADFLGLDEEGGEKWKDGSAELELEDTDEINLDEIEAAIDIADGEPADGLDIQDEELSLDENLMSEVEDDIDIELEDDIVLELEKDEPTEAVLEEIEEDEGELDLSDLNLGEEQDAADEPDVIDSGDIELEFQVGDEDIELETREEQPETAPVQVDAETFSIEDTIPAQSATDAGLEAPVKPMKAKKSSSKGLIFFFILILLGGLGYLYYAVTIQGMDIPYVSEFLQPKDKDPAGILKLSTMDINSKFVDKDDNSRLFVIEGKVRNGYSSSRKMIRLQGKLFTQGKVLVKTEFAYAGVHITDPELHSLSATDIKKRLNSGIAQGGTTTVPPGRSIPFVVVFSELPENLDEFAIEVISSMPAK